MTVDIVIPVYGQADMLRRCLASVFAHTPPEARLVVIDDCSPDRETARAIDELADDPRCLVIRNRKNRGFAATVNRGFRMGRGDVVILNSDTVVTTGWLEKLRACAYSRPNVASVTPLTNDGTICAVPEWNRWNPIPEGFSLEEYARVIEALSGRSYPELPTGVGFCMYITRAALDAVGVLDVITFGSGYGEENDWCMRAAAVGFRHLLDDATFVYHEGGSSFGAAKSEKLERSYAALIALHPRYHELVHSFIARNPLAPIQRTIQTAIRARTARRIRALVLLHTPPETLGGTESHTRDLLSSAPGVDFLVLYPRGRSHILEEIRDGETVSRDEFPEGPPGCDGRATSWWNGLLRRFSIDVVHIQHLLGHDTAVAAASKSQDVPTVFVWHDYYLACPTYTLVNHHGVFCDWCTDLDECDRCLATSSNLPTGFQSAWRKKHAAFLGSVDAHVFPSDAALEGARRIYEIPRDRAHVLPHGGWPTEPCPQARLADGGRLRIAYLGVWRPSKGSDVFAAMIRLLGVRDFEWHVFGASADDGGDPIPRGAIVHGHFAREDVCAELRNAAIDVVVLASIWPETFSYTLSEAWAAGIPVLGSSLGAVGERIRAEGAGWEFDPRRPEQGADVLRRIHRNREELADKTARARGVRLRRMSEMAASYVTLYRRLLGISASEVARAHRDLPIEA